MFQISFMTQPELFSSDVIVILQYRGEALRRQYCAPEEQFTVQTELIRRELIKCLNMIDRAVDLNPHQMDQFVRFGHLVRTSYNLPADNAGMLNFLNEHLDFVRSYGKDRGPAAAKATARQADILSHIHKYLESICAITA